MKYAICNEMFKGWAHAKVADTVARLGYQGIELAPFTLADAPDKIPAAAANGIRRTFEDRGVAVMGLHWLLAKTEGLSITSEDDGTLARTADYLKGLMRLARNLGAEVMVFGSPAQRRLAPGQDAAATRERVTWLFKDLALAAADAGTTICFEPLAAPECNFVTTMREGVELVEAVDHPAFKLHLDVKAMVAGESTPPAAVVKAEGGRHLRHFHANDPNLLGPGMGDVDQRPIGDALRTIGYNRWVSVETFVEGPGPEEIARCSMESLTSAYR